MILQKYSDEMVRSMQRLYPQMTRQDIRKAVEYSIKKRYSEKTCRMENNYTGQQVQTTLLEMTNYILKKQPICTAYGVLFRKKGEVPNPLADLIKSFLDDRDVNKRKKFEYLEKRDYDNVAKYDLFQLLNKRDANSIYGCLGNAACVLYNLFVAAAIPAQGRSLISTATMFFEGFLANNVKFGSLEEIVHYIDNVCGEASERHYNDYMMLDRNITVEECFSKIIMTCGDWRKGKIKWIPDREDLAIIYDMIANLSQEDINRIYYKNNLYEFMSNRAIRNSIIYILKRLNKPFLSPGDVPKEIQVELDTLQDMMREYVYYKHMYIDRINRCNNMIKDVCAISDTDSTIVSFDAFYHFVLDMIVGEDIAVAKQPVKIFDIDTSLSDTKPFEYIPDRISYDFYKDEIIEVEQLRKPFEIIPQNNLRFSIINIIAYISGNLCNEYLVEYTKGNNSWRGEDVKCMLYLKNEFLFNRALLTPNKKNYATIQQLQEGVIIEQTQSKSMDIKGLPINKSTLNDAAKAALQKILYDHVLKPNKINQVEIIRQIAILEKNIEKSLKSGSKEFYKPAAIKSMSNYDDPMRIQGVKAALIWNRVRNHQLEAIDLDARNTIGIVKVLITPENAIKIKDEFPEEYEKLMEVFDDTNIFKPDKNGKQKAKSITALAIPVNVDTPKWVRYFIDYKAIINDSITNFPIESVGITKLGRSKLNYSNIMKI